MNSLISLLIRLLILLFCFIGLVDAKPLTEEEALHLDWMDPQVSPSQNFFAYANGAWQKNNPIPPAYASWGTFNIVEKEIQSRIHQMLIQAANNKQAKSGSIEQKVGDFYFSGMDEKLINEQGIKPLQPEFSRIESLKTISDLQAVMTHLQLIGVDALFSFGSMQDFKDSKLMIGAASQGGLGLPDRDYYLKEDTRSKQIRQLYVGHLVKMFELLGDAHDRAVREASTVMDIETALAKASMSLIEQRDPHAVYHLMSLDDVKKITPHFSWTLYVAAIGQSQIKQINIGMPKFFSAMDQLLTTVPLDQWKIYLRWQLINAFAPYLSSPFVEEAFTMTKVLTGTQSILPRWKRVVKTESNALGFAIGKLYVERYFSPTDKQKVIEIIENIRQEFSKNLAVLPWMTPKTRKEALKKLALMENRVGYPDKWWDYSTLEINRGPYVLNVMRATQFLIKRDLNKIDKPIDRTEWSMTPQTVNAYYDPSMNNINLPAGILQPPFFNLGSDAINYGAIGFIIGHEITHGFDDQGAQFDGEGNLKNWWEPSDLKKFQAATRCIMEQFSQYKIPEGLPVQGQLVMGEATADLGGLILAYNAFHHSEAYKKAKTIKGFSPDQQFFLGAAHSWSNNIRPELARHYIIVDPHPPILYRVNGSFANMPQFQSAFGIPNDSPMVNKKRCIIW